MPDTVRQVPISDDRYRCSGAGTDSYPSSPAVSPSHSFKRSKSTFYLLDRRTSPPPGRLLQPQNVTAGTIHGCATFFWTLVNALFGLPWVNVLLVRIPSLCLCLWLRCVWKCARVPLVVSKHVLRLCIASSNRLDRGRFTVLINGGSTVQGLHLARNFHQAGVRVIVSEIDGRAELCSFSVAIDGHYTVPGPTEDNCVLYVDALRAIVEREQVDLYVPTGATVSAYYDAVAKPHLELLGCRCWTPGLDGVALLNDLSEVFRMCETVGLSVPKHLLVCSKDDVIKLYDNVSFRADRHFIVNVGQSGCKSAHSLQLPATRKSLRLPGPVSDDCPWLLVQHCLGSYYTTCTTVQAGRVVANVTFTAHDGRARDHNELIDDWTARFVSAVPVQFDGYLSFRVCVSPSRKVVPLGCRVGVPITYASYRSNFEHVVMQCPTPQRGHRSNGAAGAVAHVDAAANGAPPQSTDLVVETTNRYYATTLLYETVTRMMTVQSVKHFVRTVVTEREMVFAYWDPLPFFAHYSLQMIVDRINTALDETAILSSAQKNRYTTF
ncbi:uncharacterized protein LOC103310054 [Acyrthosiphon pisum]|uniref:Uncharacterized protein n=1 Tax=Acyrthosiphon pisum TaxID=7029 RepID=A0A8R2FA61_ACYPI|nr:uncharacterized protein LOC103310054 [Acyrthosiphon pisum]|eukprot:XP_008185345.1 PREDICTED: uncharacterized protein LOC103310054 [Acyrthosiphon pisum]